MINLTYGATSTELVCLTLTEKLICGCDDPAFVFKFTSRQTRYNVVFTAGDVSVIGSRYNAFNLQVVDVLANQDVYNGKPYLPQPGQYDYVVYEFERTIPQDLDLANALAVLEVGLVTVADPVTQYFFEGVTGGTATTLPSFTG